MIVVADPERGGIPDGRAVAATHARSFDRGPQIENSAQVVDLNAWKIMPLEQQGMNRLIQAVPVIFALLAQAAQRVENPGAMDQQARNGTGRRGHDGNAH